MASEVNVKHFFKKKMFWFHTVTYNCYRSRRRYKKAKYEISRNVIILRGYLICLVGKIIFVQYALDIILTWKF